MGRRSEEVVGSSAGAFSAATSTLIVPALGFFLEVAMLASFFYWGFRQHEPWNFILGIGIPAVLVVLWGLFMAPKSERRLSLGLVRSLSLLGFVLGGVALLLAHAQILGAVMIVLAGLWFAAGLFFENKKA